MSLGSPGNNQSGQSVHPIFVCLVVFRVQRGGSKSRCDPCGRTICKSQHALPNFLSLLLCSKQPDLPDDQDNVDRACEMNEGLGKMSILSLTMTLKEDFRESQEEKHGIPKCAAVGLSQKKKRVTSCGVPFRSPETPTRTFTALPTDLACSDPTGKLAHILQPCGHPRPVPSLTSAVSWDRTHYPRVWDFVRICGASPPFSCASGSFPSWESQGVGKASERRSTVSEKGNERGMIDADPR
jgi:hypothetical protein